MSAVTFRCVPSAALQEMLETSLLYWTFGFWGSVFVRIWGSVLQQQEDNRNRKWARHAKQEEGVCKPPPRVGYALRSRFPCESDVSKHAPEFAGVSWVRGHVLQIYCERVFCLCQCFASKVVGGTVGDWGARPPSQRSTHVRISVPAKCIFQSTTISFPKVRGHEIEWLVVTAKMCFFFQRKIKICGHAQWALLGGPIGRVSGRLSGLG